MKFCSTRGGARGASFEEAISSGYAPDGGLYVPEALPLVSTGELARWRGLGFAELAVVILELFVGGELGGREEMRACLMSAKSTPTPPTRCELGKDC